MIFKNVKNINIPEGAVVKIATALDGIILWRKKIEIPNNEIWYTSTDGNIIEPEIITGNALISNTYENGVGRLVYEGEVTKLPDYMFAGISTLSSITLPSSLTTIGNGAFNSCKGLIFIEIPDSVTDLGVGTFKYCTSLKSIKLSNSLTVIRGYCFDYCEKLNNVIIPDSVTTIDLKTFTYCFGLKSIKLSNSLTTIGEAAFEMCGLKSIEIPNSVTTIGVHAFEYCGGLKSIEIPNSVTSLGKGAFKLCDNLNSVTIPDSINIINTATFNGTRKLNSIISESLIAPSISVIDGEYNAFNLAGADIPEGEKFIYIHQDADYESYTTGEWKTQLIDTGWRIRFIEGGEPEPEEPENPDTPDEPIEPEEPEIVIPTGNTILYTSTDGEMLTVNSVYNPVVLSHTYENGIGRIEMSTMQDRVESSIFDDAETRLKTITIGDGFPTIEELAECTNLEEVIMGDSVTTIEDMAFRNDSKLNKVVLSNEITEIPSECFSKCSSLTNIVIPEKVTTISASAFDETGLQEVIIPDSVTFLSSSAFWLCGNLKSIVIGSGVTSLEENGNYFFRCYYLGSITVKAMEAPALNGSTFGCGSKAEGDKILYIYEGATGYEAWLEKLPGFTIEYITE